MLVLQVIHDAGSTLAVVECSVMPTTGMAVFAEPEFIVPIRRELRAMFVDCGGLNLRIEGTFMRLAISNRRQRPPVVADFIPFNGEGALRGCRGLLLAWC
jgi:hypothetical protein